MFTATLHNDLMKRRSSTTLLGAMHTFAKLLHYPLNSFISMCLQHIIHTVTQHSSSMPLPTLQLKRRSSATLPGIIHIFTQHSYSAPLSTPVAEGGLKIRSPSTLEHIIPTVTEHRYYTPLPTLQLKRRSSATLPGATNAFAKLLHCPPTSCS